MACTKGMWEDKTRRGNRKILGNDGQGLKSLRKMEEKKKERGWGKEIRGEKR